MEKEYILAKINLNENQVEILKSLINYAHKILNPENGETPYSVNKKIISDVFIKTENWSNKDEIRLTLIDSMYSTNMSKRMYGISDIVKKIDELKQNNIFKKSLKEDAIGYINDENKEKYIGVISLFLSSYGMTKGDADSQKTAPSLISKYLYFLTDFNFPIYDSLVRESLNNIFNLEKNMDFIYCFNKLSEINKTFSINNFDKLDNLLWLWGKIESGNYSLILDRNNYSKMVEKMKLKNKKSIEIDREMKKRENEVMNILNNNDFIEFINLKNSWNI